jgi:SAM-dependent methyltransferase
MPYQSFDEQSGDSDSHEKLRRLGFPTDMTGLSVLDVGCNEGYFCQEAWGRGAVRVIGVDKNPDFLDQARTRDERTDYVSMDFADVASLGEKFDVILLLSALHYASDPEQLLCDLVSLLRPQGLFILECGIAPGSGAEWVPVERHGDIVRHPTRAMVMRALKSASVRRVGLSVEQAGDPIPRQVFHVCHLRPIVFLVAGPSGSGKTTILHAMSNADEITAINLDAFLVTMADWAEDDELVSLRTSRDFKSDRLYELVDEMTDAGVEDRFAEEFVARKTRIATGEARPITVIEGYALARGRFAAAFTERLRRYGCYVWHVQPAEKPPDVPAWRSA